MLRLTAVQVAVGKITFEAVAGGIGQDTFAGSPALDKIALIAIAVCVGQDAFAVKAAIDKIAFIAIAGGIGQDAFACSLAIDKIALVNRAVGIGQDTFAVKGAIDKIALVARAADTGQVIAIAGLFVHEKISFLTYTLGSQPCKILLLGLFAATLENPLGCLECKRFEARIKQGGRMEVIAE